MEHIKTVTEYEIDFVHGAVTMKFTGVWYVTQRSLVCDAAQFGM
jgi:hypothetical protein